MNFPAIVLYDACVLYPAALRDVLMQLATTGLFQAKWTDQIHEEWIRGVLRTRPDLCRRQLDAVRDMMNLHAGDALVVDYESLIPKLVLPDPNDRHVLAAAIRAQASLIVTCNLKDFPSSALASHCIRALHPDDFLCGLIKVSPVVVRDAVQCCRGRLRRPPLSIDCYFHCLAQQALPKTVAALRTLMGVPVLM